MLAQQKILTGHTMHWRRTAEAEHRFRYPVLYFRLPVTEKLSETRCFKQARFGLYSFFAKDHGEKKIRYKTLHECFQSILNSQNLNRPLFDSVNRVELITQARVLGFVFNPVSFWLAYDQQDKLIFVLAEVNNTFGERLIYLLHLDDAMEITSQHLLHAEKKLRVSPFFEVKGQYAFKFSIRDQQIDIVINYYRDPKSRESESSTQTLEASTNTPSLIASMNVQAQDFTDRNLLKCFFRYGFSTLLVVARIHWQALKLKLKGAIFYRSKKKTEQDFKSG